jgi:threonyl-tRNA synthetase
MDLAQYFMDTLGVTEITHRLSIWDDDRDHWLGSDEQWHNAIEALRGALEERGMKYFEGRGEAAFYGPKIDYQVRDAAGREFTNNTIQVDFQQPDNFGLEYVAADGSRQRPVMIHRGAFGSMERMMAYLIEKYAGAFPTWLHPVQVVVIPITDAQNEYAEQVGVRLRQARVRVQVDTRGERSGKKVSDARRQRVPYMAVVGAREAESVQVSVRDRAGEQTVEELEAFVQKITVEVAVRRLGPSAGA